MSLFYRLPFTVSLCYTTNRCIARYSTTTVRMAKHERSESTDGADDALKHPPVKRAKEIDQDPPMSQLEAVLKKNKSDGKARNVLHWFRSKDLRLEDNRALHAASQKAKDGSNLITMYLFSPKDMEWHGTSPARSDFILESLRIMKDQLQKKNIPLAMVTAEERGEKVDDVVKFVKDNDISHVSTLR